MIRFNVQLWIGAVLLGWRGNDGRFNEFRDLNEEIIS